MYIKGRAEQQGVFRIFNVIICWAHQVCGISKIVAEFVII